MSEEGLKFDSDKTPLDLLPFAGCLEIAKVLAHGREKYSAHNWRKGMAWSRLLGAALRHLFSWAMGENNDSETGLSHLAHAGCCVLFLIEYQLHGIGHDDRYCKKENKTHFGKAVYRAYHPDSITPNLPKTGPNIRTKVFNEETT